MVLPAALRRRDRIVSGQQFEIERVKRGEYRLIRKEPVPNEGLIALLLACPVKGYFAPIESESTDTL